MKKKQKETPQKHMWLVWAILGTILIVWLSTYAGELVATILFLIIIGSIYMLPTIIAIKKRKKQTDAILIVNLFLGWTFIGWVIALVWATMHD